MRRSKSHWLISKSRKGGGVVLSLMGGSDVFEVESVIILVGGVEIQENTSYSSLYPSL